MTTDDGRLSRQDVTEGAPYEHPEHGRVVIVAIDDGTVYLDLVEKRLTNSNYTPMTTESFSQFRRIADPLPQSLDLPSSTAFADTFVGGV